MQRARRPRPCYGLARFSSTWTTSSSLRPKSRRSSCPCRRCGLRVRDCEGGWVSRGLARGTARSGGPVGRGDKARARTGRAVGVRVVVAAVRVGVYESPACESRRRVGWRVSGSVLKQELIRAIASHTRTTNATAERTRLTVVRVAVGRTRAVVAAAVVVAWLRSLRVSCWKRGTERRGCR